MTPGQEVGVVASFLVGFAIFAVLIYWFGPRKK